MSDPKEPGKARLSSVPEGAGTGRRNSEEARHGHGQQDRFHHQQREEERRTTAAEQGGKSPEVGFGRRESQLSYGFKLLDGRYRPPETDEEWNAFYQECVPVSFVSKGRG